MARARALITEFLGDYYGVRAKWSWPDSPISALGEDGWFYVPISVGKYNASEALRWVLKRVIAIRCDDWIEYQDRIEAAIAAAKWTEG
jgi:hypothetical protein